MLTNKQLDRYGRQRGYQKHNKAMHRFYLMLNTRHKEKQLIQKDPLHVHMSAIFIFIYLSLY